VAASQVPFLDVGAAYRELRTELDAAVGRVLTGGHYILGAELEAFESEFAAFVEAGHAVGVANGLEALFLSLRALGIGPGDEVLVPANTFIATWLAVSQAGGVPVPVEPVPGVWTMDPSLLHKALTRRTKAVIPVHLYGQPAELTPILEFARKNGLRVVEDAAQAHGARYQGERIGAHGDAVAWSFYPAKNLGCAGDGGAITTDDDALAERLRVLRNYGSRVKYDHEVAGVNSRLDEVQAAILRVKLRRLDEWNARRSMIAERYLADLRGLPRLDLPTPVPEAPSVWHLFVVDHPRRDELQAHLSGRGIQTLIHYPVPPHRSGAYADTGLASARLPITESAAATHLSLPIGPHLSEEQAGRVIEAARGFCSHRAG